MLVRQTVCEKGTRPEIWTLCAARPIWLYSPTPSFAEEVFFKATFNNDKDGAGFKGDSNNDCPSDLRQLVKFLGPLTGWAFVMVQARFVDKGLLEDLGNLKDGSRLRCSTSTADFRT